MVSIDLKYAKGFIEEDDKLSDKILSAYKQLTNKEGLGNDFLGWLELPEKFDKDEYARIKSVSKKILEHSDVLLVIGIGGSYLGAKAAIEALSPQFKIKNSTQVIFVGHHMSSTYIQELINYLQNKSFSINVISKSGTTTEPAISFRIFKQILIERHGELEAYKRIYATTDKEKGALKNLADSKSIETFVVPNNVGGRFSILTAVGLLPMAVAGIDIDQLMEGALIQYNKSKSISKNDPLFKYVYTRNFLYQKGKKIELLVNYDPRLTFLSEWWKQLFGESEGKDNLGIFPASASFSTDLHSLGQYIQEGERHIFETVIMIEKPSIDLSIPTDDSELDGLKYLEGTSVDYINKQAFTGTLLAHHEGGVPNIVINIDELNAKTFGELIYFFELACGVSGYTLGVNPFNQPGVEAYKKNMFALLEKPGFEELTKEIMSKINEIDL
jgi:glucose-6-phosphate isomerase